MLKQSAERYATSLPVVRAVGAAAALQIANRQQLPIGLGSN